MIHDPDGSWPLVITRRLAAPRERVFAAWSDLDQLQNWWGTGPADFAAATLDFRPGGRFHYGVKMQDGGVSWGLFAFVEIDDGARIAYTSSFSNAAGEIVRPVMQAPWPARVMNVISLTTDGDHTVMRHSAAAHNATAAERLAFPRWAPMLQQGFTPTYDRLGALVAA